MRSGAASPRVPEKLPESSGAMSTSVLARLVQHAKVLDGTGGDTPTLNFYLFRRIVKLVGFLLQVRSSCVFAFWSGHVGAAAGCCLRVLLEGAA